MVIRPLYLVAWDAWDVKQHKIDQLTRIPARERQRVSRVEVHFKVGDLFTRVENSLEEQMKQELATRSKQSDTKK